MLQKLKQKNYKFFKKRGYNNTGKIVVFNKDSTKKSRNIVNLYNYYRGVAEKVDYNSNKNSFLLRVYDLEKRKHFYTTLTQNLCVGSFIISNYQVKIKIGNRCFIKNIPTGILLNNIEFKGSILKFNKKNLAKSAGCFAQLVQKLKNFCLIKLPSGKYKRISPLSFATIGLVSNSDYNIKNLGKSGRSRWLNKRPNVRGVAMNPIDHPHGGGEGKTSGNKFSPWGQNLKK